MTARACHWCGHKLSRYPHENQQRFKMRHFCSPICRAACKSAKLMGAWGKKDVSRWAS